MRRLAPVIVLFSFSLWLGGLAALLLFVISLNRIDHAQAIGVNPRLFQIFEPRAVACALVCFWSTAFWALRTWSRLVLLVLIFLGVALSAMLVNYGIVTPHVISAARGTPEFWKWHGASNAVYLTQVFMLVMAGLALPGAIRSTAPQPSRRTGEAVVPGSAPRGASDRPAT